MPGMPAPEPGLVIRYDFLWSREVKAGREHGKDRPACIVVVVDKPTMPLFAALLPITHTRPTNSSQGIEIPATTRRRLGLDDQPCWIIFSEYNVERWPPPGLSPVPKRAGFTYGHIPSKLFEIVRAQFQAAIEAGLTARVTRSPLSAKPPGGQQ